MFVEKLKDIESSFVELSHDMIESENVQIEAQSQKMRTRAVKNNNERDQLEQSIEQALLEDSHDSQLEQLTALNEQVQEENRELREHVKQLEKELEQGAAKELDTIRAQLEEVYEENDQLQTELQNCRCERESDKITYEHLKKTNEKIKADLSEEIRSKDFQITAQLKSLTDYELGINSLKSKLQDAIEQKQIL